MPLDSIAIGLCMYHKKTYELTSSYARAENYHQFNDGAIPTCARVSPSMYMGASRMARISGIWLFQYVI